MLLQKRSSTVFLKAVLILIGIVVLAVCLFGLPVLASRDAAKHPDTAYLQFFFLGYVYILCTPIFGALYQALKILSYIDKNEAFSNISVRALRFIKRCAITIVILILIGVITSIFLFNGKEDITGIIMLALLSIFASCIIATFAAVLQRLLQKAINIKSENDLVV
ncbi:DUF2975 domain-containing protein [Ureibacillus chungkukjangi]|uniref:DUF2975 domain-containing protein n=1 Tax=Ureibacillus chungkukjangi TaxID=1202712 RepID=UPI00203CAB6D|nr:DUF2975 domain-containing protein [Ureibacillus chungkukjangi]MCM3388899.1 DUF2975 domain-containing protein [Ureibacillus chungkukjangi]